MAYEEIPLVSFSSPTSTFAPRTLRNRTTRTRWAALCSRVCYTTLSLVGLVGTSLFLWKLLQEHTVTGKNASANSSGTGDIGMVVGKTRNGTYHGLRLHGFGQDAWLDMPYAMPPTGQLRFRHPRPFNESWDGFRSADQYGPHCPGYGDHESAFVHAEDCLKINVIRPSRSSNYPTELLPVAVFIHGGMNHGGGPSDPRYNMSFLLQTAENAGLPFMAVTFNYRASMWGFLGGQQIMGTANANLGLHDQRLALRWVHENIAGFGGDASRVTLWGGSSGADDVGFHLLAHNGRDDGLFRAAIMQSGSPIAKVANSIGSLQEMYDHLVVQTGCANATDSLDCLRGLDYSVLNAAFADDADGTSERMKAFSKPSVDGTFIPTYSSLALHTNRFVRVPILTGIMTNEGSSSIPSDVRVWKDERRHLVYDLGFPGAVADQLMSLYEPIQVQTGDVLDPPIKSIASLAEFRRIERLEGDLSINAADRLQCEAYTEAGAHCYSFRFNAAIPTRLDPRLGVTHASEIAPLFQNVHGLGFNINPFSGANNSTEFRNMARLMGIMWAGFIVGLNPNLGLTEANNASGIEWPNFSLAQRERMVFNSTGPWVEHDFDRIEAMSFINSIQHSILKQ